MQIFCQMNGTKINQESSYLKDQEQNHVVQQSHSWRSKRITKGRVIRRQLRGKDKKNKSLFFAVLAFLSCTSTPARIEQTKEEEAANLPHYLGCLFQNISSIPRNTKYIFKRSQLMQDPETVQYCILTSQHRSLSFLTIFFIL